jgi:hypothetical protein
VGASQFALFNVDTSTKSSTDTAAIVGGVVGAAVGLIAIGLFLLFWTRSRNSKVATVGVPPNARSAIELTPAPARQEMSAAEMAQPISPQDFGISTTTTVEPQGGEGGEGPTTN